ncbi:MAG: hypothetical protein OHK0047_13450 [Leptolyngbyaceae cyanobacterium]
MQQIEAQPLNEFYQGLKRITVESFWRGVGDAAVLHSEGVGGLPPKSGVWVALLDFGDSHVNRFTVLQSPEFPHRPGHINLQYPHFAFAGNRGKQPDQ